MPDLLLELFSEEIPARMQRRAAEDLRKLVTDALVEAGLVYEGAKAFATPRRLALTVHGLPARAPDRREGEGHRRFSQGSGSCLARRGEDRARCEEGRLPCRCDREARRAGGGVDRRRPARDR